MMQFKINISIISTFFNKFLSYLIIISLILPDCASCMYEEEMEHITSFSKSAVIVVEDNDESDEIAPENDIPLETFNQHFESTLEDEKFTEHLINLSNNPLVGLAKDHLDVISRKSISKTYAKRKAAILFTLFAGATISTIGSLTFLIGEHFPDEFAKFAGFSISDDVASGLGKYLGGSNVALETLFYIFTIYGMLPSLKPKQSFEAPVEAENPSFFRRCCSKFTSWLPSVGEWGLAIASAIPLTLLSLIDQEAEGIEGLKYAVVACIGLVTLVSNKFFLTLTHGQLKEVWAWLKSLKKGNNPHSELDFLEQVKEAFTESTICANEKLKHLSQKDLGDKISSLKEITEEVLDLEIATPDQRWVKLTNHIFEDLSFAPPKVNKKAVILTPAFAIFTALSWLGLIATVPGGIEKMWSSPSGLQYPIMVIAGIPLIEIGLSVGGSFGLQLSRIGEGARSLNETLTHWIQRYIGYTFITLAGLGSFATTATLTIQQFKSVPAVCWMLLPSATLGMNLINISTGCEIWDETVAAAARQITPDKALFAKHVNFLQDFQRKLELTRVEDVAMIILSLEASVQENIMHFMPSMEEITDSQEWKTTIIRKLKEKMTMN